MILSFFLVPAPVLCNLTAEMLSALVLLQNLRWMVPTTFMIGAAPAYISVWGAWRLLSAVFPRWVYVMGDDFLFSTYHRNVLFFFETLTGTEILFYGDVEGAKYLAKGENALFLSNHQCTVDWVMASSVALRRGSLGRLRYILKDGLRFLPLYGFYMGMHGSVFVKRAGKFRKDKADKQLFRDAKDKLPIWMVIFPEGTRYNPELENIIEESKSFALEQGLAPLEQVLFPRVGATQVCVENLHDVLDCVYDVTLAYSDTVPSKGERRKTAPTMQDFLMGSTSKVHIHIKRIPTGDVPTDTNSLRKWLHQHYQEKDKLLNYFYSGSSEKEAKFPGESVSHRLPLMSLLPSVVLWGGLFTAANSFKESRDLYWKVGLGAACAGILWMGVRH